MPQRLQQASALIDQGKLTQAQALLSPLAADVEKQQGPDSALFAEVLNQLGHLSLEQGQYGLAEARFLRSLQILKALQGEHSLGVGRILNNLGILYEAQGELKRALSYYEQWLHISETILGPSSPEVASGLFNMAHVHMTWWSLDQAAPLFQRALQIQEAAAVGRDDLAVANTLLGIADVYFRQGAYERAEPLQARALRIFEQRLGPHSPQLAKTLSIIADLAAESGDYERAEPLLQRAVAAFGDAQGTGQLELAWVLEKLARLKLHLSARGQLAALKQPERLLQRAIQLAEPFGAREAASYQCRLGEVYLLQGDLQQAAAALNRGLFIEQPDGKVRINPDPDGMHAASVINRELGRFVPALSIEESALRLRKQRQGENHPGVAQSYQALAGLRALQGQSDEAAALLLEALTLTERRLRTQGLALSERRLTQLLALLREQEEEIYSLVLRAPENKALRRLALTALLLRKGRAVDEVALTSLLESQIQDSADRKRFEQLRDLHGRLAHLALQSAGRIAPETRERLFKELTAQAEAIELELAARLAPLRERRQTLELAHIVAHVAAALPQDAVLVELVTFTERPPEQKLGAPDGPLHYLAFVLARDGEAELVDLGPAAPIESAAVRLQAALSSPKAEYLAAAQDAYRRLFAPLLPALGGRHRVVISPDGVLALAPFAALHDGQQFVLAGYDISYVTSGRDLLRSDVDTGTPSQLVVVADPAFRRTPAARAGESRGTSRRDRGLQLGALLPLPGTREEALAIKKLWPQAQLLLGPDATEPAVLALGAPTVLHIATHGIFMSDAQPSPSARSPFGLARGFDAVAEPLPPNPLLRSALVLAGAQDSFGVAAAQGQAGAKTGADGLATALEVSGMNLWGTQLVVLSACDTGRGEVVPGQGVYGLRRAIAAAGAETLVTSLWRLNDRLTVDLMSRYYQGLRAGEGRVAALRAAALAVRAQHPHPYYWASFIAIGQPGPLRGAR